MCQKRYGHGEVPVSSENNNDRLKVLIIELLDNTISPENHQELTAMLNSDKEACRYYAEYIMVCAALKQYSSSTIFTGRKIADHLIDESILQLLKNTEENSPAVYIEHEIIEDKKPIKNNAKKHNPFTRLLLTTLSIAALLILVINAFLGQNVAVAKVSDTISTKWNNTSVSNGDTIYNSKKEYELLSGLIKLRYSNATVLVEGPCKFRCLTDHSITMNYGSVYVKMDNGANGFIVNTPVSQIVDLGTEFGVQAYKDRSTEVHVIKGKTSVTAKKNRYNTDTLTAGNAKSVDNNGKSIHDIEFEEYKFIRAFDSGTNIVYRGRDYLDLADITAGGNGTGIAKKNIWINPTKGYVDASYSYSDKLMPFKELDSNDFIDGLFIPDKDQSEVITSTNIEFNECPDTSGNFYTNIGINPALDYLYIKDTRNGEIILENTVFGTDENPCILLHANIGITYDLQKINQQFPYQSVKNFKSRIGIADMNENSPCNADFWVLVDGEVRYSLKNVSEKGKLHDLNISLSVSDRFLTLITTDGGDEDIKQAYKRSITCDWCVFTNPILELN